MDGDGKIIRISVRNLVEFLLRRGDLDTGSGPASEAAMLEGARIHRKLQKKAGEGYRAEAVLRLDVPVRLPGDLSGEFPPAPAGIFPVFSAEGASAGAEGGVSGSSAEGASAGAEGGASGSSAEGAVLRLEGRADGIYREEDLWVIDEIKTLPGTVRSLQEPQEVHLAQARCYAYIFAETEGLKKIGIRMTYCSQESEEVRYFRETLCFEELKSWFSALLGAYAPWMRLRQDLAAARRESLREMAFPFPYREGQYELAAGVYRTIVHGRKLFLQAPTGTGKTLAVLFPALKAIGAGKAERIFYLTARGVTGRVALETLALLQTRGLRIRSLELVSRERACACGAVDCRPPRCPRAAGHFDRVNGALWALLTDAGSGRPMTSQRIAACARKYSVCPYALSMDAVDFADVVICDYNYVFHPEARLTRFFGPAARGGSGAVLLIDEAHNLLERGRAMYSADLSCREVRAFRRSVKTQRPRLWKRLRGLVHVLRKLDREMEEGAQVRILPGWTAPEKDGKKGSGLSVEGGREPGRPEEACIPPGEKGDEKARQGALDGTEDGKTPQGSLDETGAGKTLQGALEGTEDGKTPQGSLDETGAGKTLQGALDGTGDGKPSGSPRDEMLRELRMTLDEIHWILEQERRGAAAYAAIHAGVPVQPEGTAPVEDLLEFYFRLSHFRQMLEGADHRYIVYGEKGRVGKGSGESGRFAEEAGAKGRGERSLEGKDAGAKKHGGGGRSSGGGFSLHLFCADPSGNLLRCMAGTVSAVLFSATFLPIQYYKGLLGGTPEDFEMYARSSFSREQLRVVIARGVTSRYRDRRPENFARIAEGIGQVIACRPGNYLVYFPSYLFMENVLEAFRRICGASPAGLPAPEDGFSEGPVPEKEMQRLPDPRKDMPEGMLEGPAMPEGVLEGPAMPEGMLEVPAMPEGVLRAPAMPEGMLEGMLEAPGGHAGPVPVTVLVQRPQMDDRERAAFLEAFEEVRGDRHLAGFCVLGGMFGEGIDLQRDRLIGSIVVGTGIPPVEPQRELLREYFAREGKNGYDFAYRFPGMNKVLQAAGRVIRTAEDRGVIVLMDDRFDRAENRELFPLEWDRPKAAGTREAAGLVRQFWEENVPLPVTE